MGSFPGSSEIVEAEDEPSSSRHAKGMYHQSSGLSMRDKDQKQSVLKLGCKDSLEDDINKLFEAINLKTSKGLGLSQQAGSSPLNKHASKRPITMGMPRSPGAGSSEPATLKQALRELSLTKASEMAAMKRLSKMTASNGPSEAGRIKTLYNEVVLEARKSGPVFVEGRGNMVEISLVSEESTSNALEKMPVNLQTSRMKSPNESANSSPRFAAKQNVVGTTMVPNENVSTTKKAGSQSIKSKLSQQERTTSEPSPSRSDYGSDSLGFVDVPVATKSISVASPTRNESASTSGKAGVQTIKAVLLETEQHTSEPSPSTSCHGGKTSKLVENVPESTKLRNKPSAQRAGQKVRLHGVSSSSSSAGGNKVSKLSRANPRLMKSASRNRNLAKKKLKQDLSTAAFSSSGFDEGDAKLDPSTGQLVCERCHCTLKNASKKPSQASSGLPPKSEGNSTYGHSNANKPGAASESRAKSVATSTKAKKNTKSREKGEFSQSSQGEYSSSTTMSDESNLSGSSCGNRPHMSKDVRWEAIRQVWMQDGVLSLDHFNLLKKLGCGDIGTVYLAELIATNCLFAIKVMDNEFLARRKKMPRAQTEREILKMLDHPFLPTLFSQFTSDNLSCLVMEYCPGGDLHVLRQKQPGRNYSESAARFYVAEVLLALEYLHMLGVVYRDLKPENVLVREDGHIMLTDFDLSLRCTVSPTLLQSSSSDVEPVRRSGPCTESSCVEPFCIEPSCRVPCFSPRILPTTAKTRKNKSDQAALIRNSLPQLVAEPTDARSNSFVGTHEYLAPEIIKGDGHGAAVDWWTFGIFLYELLYGRTPFKGANNEETLANVVLQTLKFPDTPIVSFQARDLIRGLLVKEPECRFGTEKGAAEIKQHPFFEGLNWALIRCAIPPEVPEFCEFDVPTSVAAQEKETKYLECKATGELLEFELF